MGVFRTVARWGALILALSCSAAIGTAVSAHALTAKVHGGTLLIRGNEASESLRIEPAAPPASTLRVTPLAGTTLNDEIAPHDFDGVGGITLYLGAADNHVEIRNVVLDGSLVFSARDGNDDVSISQSLIGGDVLIDLGAGENHLQIADGGRVEGRLHVRGGPGADSVVLISGATVAGETTARLGNGANKFIAADAGEIGARLFVGCGNGPDFVSIGDDSGIMGDARIVLGDGDNLFSMDFAWVRGLLRVVGGRDGDVVGITSVDVAQSARFALGDGDNGFQMESGMIDGDLRVVGGAQQDDLSFGDFFASTTRLDMGDGPNSLEFEGFANVKGPLTVHGGAANDVVDFVYDVQVQQGATFALGDGDNAVSLQGTSVTEDLTIQTGRGNDTVLIYDTTTVGGRTRIDTGAGSDIIGP